jgi:shikimate kinase
MDKISRPMNIFLIGYRCTGKTTVGRRLAHKLEWQFMDSDVILMAKHGMTVADMVSRLGWEEFRSREKIVIRELGEMDGVVVATGGGVVLDPDNVDSMKKSGHAVIWLTVDIETIMARMGQDAENEKLRPALTDRPIETEIAETLAQRTPLYQSAMNLRIETDHCSAEQICCKILNHLRKSYAGKFIR